MITKSELVEAIADAIRVRRRTPKSVYPHPFELSLIKVESTLDPECNKIIIEIQDEGETRKFTFMLLEY